MVSTAKISKFLKGINFPADKIKCLERARFHGAPEDVMDVLNGMSEGYYTSMAGIWEAAIKK
jgi:hypothetical protein